MDETIKTFEYDKIIFTDNDQKMLIEALYAKSNRKIENKPKKIDSNNRTIDSIKKTDQNKIRKNNVKETLINNRKESKNTSDKDSNPSSKVKSKSPVDMNVEN